MKARIRGTNIELDVQPFYDETGYFSGFKDGYEYYRAADLVFPDTPDWNNTDLSTFRREAAKDVLVGMLASQINFHINGKMLNDTSDYIAASIETADLLIEKLKQAEK